MYYIGHMRLHTILPILITAISKACVPHPLAVHPSLLPVSCKLFMVIFSTKVTTKQVTAQNNRSLLFVFDAVIGMLYLKYKKRTFKIEYEAY